MAKNPHERNRLLGEALDYPKFAIDDFEKLSKEQKELFDGKPKHGNRVSFKCYEYGYSAFVFKPENYEKVKSWAESQKIPLKKCVFSSNETGKWENFAFRDFEKKMKR